MSKQEVIGTKEVVGFFVFTALITTISISIGWHMAKNQLEHRASEKDMCQQVSEIVAKELPITEYGIEEDNSGKYCTISVDFPQDLAHSYKLPRIIHLPVEDLGTIVYYRGKIDLYKERLGNTK